MDTNEVTTQQRLVDQIQIACPEAHRVYSQYFPDWLLTEMTGPMDPFFYPGIRDDYAWKPKPQEWYYTYIKEAPCADVMSHYRSLHKPEYIARLEQLVTTVPEGFVTPETELVAVIAARNETQLASAITALQEQYGEEFLLKVRIVVYHNYSMEPERDVQEAMADVQAYPNVVVCEEQVSPDNNVASAKKVAADIAHMLVPAERDIPFLLMDADVDRFTPGIVAAGLRALQQPFVLAASPSFDISRAAAQRFPVLGLIYELGRVSRDHVLLNDPTFTKRTIGMCTFIMRKSHAAIGGTRPVIATMDKKLKVVPFEDMQMANELANAVNWYHCEKSARVYPVYALERNGHIVFYDPSREIEDLTARCAADIRWRSPQEYIKRSGRRRLDWRNIQSVPNIPELGDPTEENLIRALKRYWDSMIVRLMVEDTFRVHSQRVIIELESRGYRLELTAHNLDGKNDPQDTVSGPTARELIFTGNGNWGIWGFDRITV